MQAPVPALEAEADRLTAWLRFGISGAAASAASTASGGSGASGAGQPGSAVAAAAAAAGGSAGASYVPSSWVFMNPDFQQVRNRLFSLHNTCHPRSCKSGFITVLFFSEDLV